MTRKQLLQFDAFDDFSKVTDRRVYHPLPEDWLIGITDVMGSTQAIEAGRYKAVNMAGASIISAVMNALGHLDFPFSFGGDGAEFAVPGDYTGVVRDVMARTARWSADEFGLQLRAAMIPIAEIRAAGADVLVAHYAPSPAVRYAMFAGGGMEWAEEALKSDRYAIEPAGPGEHADLSGLSCRWKPMKTRSGVVLSLIVRQGPDAARAHFFEALQTLLDLIDEEEREGNPVPSEGPEFGSPMAGLDLEARARGTPGWFGRDRFRLLLWRLFAWVVVKGGFQVGGFDPAHYRAQTVLNSDFKKFHDGLDMTIDCTADKADRIEGMLEGMETEGLLRFGIFRQSAALMTCIVPSYSSDNHLHFIDGAEGGYTAASRRLKA